MTRDMPMRLMPWVPNACWIIISAVLLDQALLVGGEELKDPADFVRRMNNLLSR